MPSLERKIITARLNPPIPTTAFDWIAYFDGQEEGMRGFGNTKKAAEADLLDRTHANPPVTSRLEQLRTSLAVENQGKHFIQRKSEEDCVEQLCAEIDQLRARQSPAPQEAEPAEWMREAVQKGIDAVHAEQGFDWRSNDYIAGVRSHLCQYIVRELTNHCPSAAEVREAAERKADWICCYLMHPIRGNTWMQLVVELMDFAKHAPAAPVGSESEKQRGEASHALALAESALADAIVALGKEPHKLQDAALDAARAAQSKTKAGKE